MLNLFRKRKKDTVSREVHDQEVDHWYYKYMDASGDVADTLVDCLKAARQPEKTK